MPTFSQYMCDNRRQAVHMKIRCYPMLFNDKLLDTGRIPAGGVLYYASQDFMQAKVCIIYVNIVRESCICRHKPS